MIKIYCLDAFDKEWFSGPFRLKGFEQARFDVLAFDYRAMTAVHGAAGMNDALFGSLHIYRPDVVFINKGHFGIKVESLARFKEKCPHCMVITWTGDQRGEVMEENLPCAHISDIYAQSNDDAKLKKAYKSRGIKRTVEHHCATDVDVYKSHVVWPEEFGCDVVFLGSNHQSAFPISPFRNKLLQEVDKNFRLKVYGQAWQDIFEDVSPAYRERAALAVSASKIHICINAFTHIHRYTSNRTWNALACERLVLQHRFEGCESLLGKEGENLVYFTDINDCLEKIKYYLERDQERMAIAERGRDFVLSNHTYYHRALEIKRMFDKWLENDEWEWKR